MKQWILPSIIFGIVLFFWQFLSFAALNLHEKAQQYTPQQDSIIQALKKFKLKEGGYMLPRPKPGLSNSEWETQNNLYQNQPWVRLQYYTTRNNAMLKPLLQGFFTDVVLGFFILWVLNQINFTNRWKPVLFSVMLGVISFIYLPYTNHIWYPAFDIEFYLLDALVPFAIIGFLFKYFKRA